MDFAFSSDALSCLSRSSPPPLQVSLDQDRELLTTALYAFNALTEFCQGPCDVNQSHVVTCNACVEVRRPFINA